MNAAAALITFLLAAAQAEAAPPQSGTDQAPITEKRYAKPPAEWHRTLSAPQSVEFSTPCVPKEEMVPEKSFVIATYACDVGDLMYVVIVSPLDDETRENFPEKFSALQLNTLKERASKSGVEYEIGALSRIDYSGVRGVQLKVVLGSRSIMMRVIGNDATGVSMQVLSKGPAPDQTGEQFFNSIRLK